MNLMKDYLWKGHHVFTDNYYTSPKLYKFLKENKTEATGTIWNIHQGLPLELRGLNIQKGKKHWFETNEHLSIVYADKWNVYMLSTAYSNSVETVNRRSKRSQIQVNVPTCIKDWSSFTLLCNMSKNKKMVQEISNTFNPIPGFIYSWVL